MIYGEIQQIQMKQEGDHVRRVIMYQLKQILIIYHHIGVQYHVHEMMGHLLNLEMTFIYP